MIKINGALYKIFTGIYYRVGMTITLFLATVGTSK